VTHETIVVADSMSGPYKLSTELDAPISQEFLMHEE